MRNNGITRRTFLCASGAFLLGPTLIHGNEGASKVVEIRAPRLFEGNEPDPRSIRAAISLGVQKLTNEDNAPAAWRSLLSPTDVIGVKFNHVAAGDLRGNSEVARAIVAELSGAGIPEKQIIVIEGERVTGTTRDDSDADPEKFHACGKTLWFKKYVTKQITALINVPLLKHHSIAGVSLGLKNLSHGTTWNPSDFHRGNCDPAIAEIVSLPPLREKLRLTICNALFGLADNGPYVTDPKLVWRESALLMSADIVALDAVGLELIRNRRRTMSLPELEEAGESPKHIATAARFNLGVCDPTRIELIRLD